VGAKSLKDCSVQGIDVSSFLVEAEFALIDTIYLSGFQR